MTSRSSPSSYGASKVYFDSVFHKLPEDLSNIINNILHESPSAAEGIGAMIKFVVESPDVLDELSTLGTKKGHTLKTALKGVNGEAGVANGKHKRSESPAGDDLSADPTALKRLKVSQSTSSAPSSFESPLFILHSLSVTSPIRKKADIAISASAITLYATGSTTSVLAKVQMSEVEWVFLIPTRGKTRPHWSVIMLPTSTLMETEGGTKQQQAAHAKAMKKEKGDKEVAFGVDASAPGEGFTTTTTSAGPSEDRATTTAKKGAPTLPSLQSFLSHLPSSVRVVTPDTRVFRSACAAPLKASGCAESSGAAARSELVDGDAAGIDAHRDARPGSLWFLHWGVLWVPNGRGCEFWPLSELVDDEVGVRVVSATGRMCYVFLTRKVRSRGGGADRKEEEEEGVEVEVEEVEFGGIDGREIEPIKEWISSRRYLFGKGNDDIPSSVDAAQEVKVNKGKGKAKATEAEIVSAQQEAAIANNDDTDPEDEDFDLSSSDEDGGSPTSSDSEDSGAGSGAGGSDEEEDAEGSDDGADDDEGGGGNESEEEDEEALDPRRHPLLRPGAMPRMSKGAIDAVVGMMEADLGASTGGSTRRGQADEDDDDDEEDELDD